MGRRGSRQEGISPGSLSLGGTFNLSLLEISPAPSQALGQASVCRGDLGSQGQAFIAGKLLLALGGALCRLPGADGPQWERRLALRGLAAFLPTLCVVSLGVQRPDHKGRLFGGLWGRRGHSWCRGHPSVRDTQHIGAPKLGEGRWEVPGSTHVVENTIRLSLDNLVANSRIPGSLGILGSPKVRGPQGTTR